MNCMDALNASDIIRNGRYRQQVTPVFFMSQIFCNFAASTFQSLPNGLRKVWGVGEKRVK